MRPAGYMSIKLVVLLLFLTLIFYYLSLQSNRYELKNKLKAFYQMLNRSRIMEMLIPMSNITSSIRTMNITNSTIITTKRPLINSTTDRPTTIDPAELLVERPPPASRFDSKDSKSTLAVFLFQTRHHILANLQLYLIRKLATDLVAVELFVDGSLSEDMRKVAATHQAEAFSFPVEKHKPNAGGSDRNTNVVNWAVSQRAKRYLGNGTAILLLDGDVFPLSPFDSGTLLNSRDIICRKHPGLFARFCWIGFICLGPQLYKTIDDFDVSQTMRGGRAYDSGGKTIEYFLKYENTSFSWMKETILLGTDKSLFWGAVDRDIQWIGQNFGRCDKCGPEIFFSPFNVSNAVFYHMISAASEWRFGHQGPRRQSIYDSIIQSPYGPNQNYSLTDMISSVRKVQNMEPIPFYGKLTCQKVCQG